MWIFEFEKDETTLLEVFSFGFVSNGNSLLNNVSNDQYLIEAEEVCRGILLSLDEKCKNLKNLPRDDWTAPKDDFLVEMLEVLINTIIYVRNVYPPSIFKRKKIYNTACYICIYPPLKEYIQNVLKTAATLKRQNELEKIDLVFEKDETTLLEVFSFGFFSNGKSLFDDVSNDQYLIEAEEVCRGILLSLDEKCKNLKNLPRDGVNFKILLHTTQVALVKLTSDPKLQDFPWTQGQEIIPESNTILPMAHVSGFQLTAEDFL